MNNKIKNIKVFIILIILVIIILGFIIFKTGLFANFISKKANFDVDNVLFKFSVKEGESFSKNLIISNNEKRIKLNVSSDLDFVSLSESEFFLNPQEKKVLEFVFNIKDKEPGVYIGKIRISGGGSALEIPIILEIETKEILFDSTINVPIDYSNVYIGEKMVIENRIFNFGAIGSKSIKVNYAIQDLKGKKIFSDEEDMIVESQILNTKVISIPENVEKGDYVFTAIIKYEDSVGTSSYFFKIVNKKTDFMAEGISIWVAFILLSLIIGLLIYNLRQRDKIFLELNKQYRKALNTKLEKKKKEKKKIMRLKPLKRRIEIKKFNQRKKKEINVIKKIYRSRVKEIKKLKKVHNKKEIQKKIEQWKRQGYDTSILENKKENKIKPLNLREIKKKIQEWKSKGYHIKSKR